MIVDFKKFRETEAASPSRLSDLDYSPLYYKERKEARDKDTSSFMKFGSLVDCLLTEPGEFDKRYNVSSIEFPSDAIKNIITGVFDDLKNRYLEDPYDPIVKRNGNLAFSGLDEFKLDILKHAKYEGYGQSWKEDTIFNKVKTAGEQYFLTLLASIGKEMVSFEDYEKALLCIQNLKDSEFTKQYFSDEQNPDIEFLWQVPIVWEEDGMTCKGLLDLVIIDHVNKIIYIIDLKTTAKSVYNFEHSYIKFRYYLQGSMYYQGLRKIFNQDKKYEGYSLNTPLFVVAEQGSHNPPFIFEMSYDDMMVGTFGGIIKSSGREVKGYKRLLSDLKWHNDTGIWDFPKDVWLNKGKVKLECFKPYP